MMPKPILTRRYHPYTNPTTTPPSHNILYKIAVLLLVLSSLLLIPAMLHLIIILRESNSPPAPLTCTKLLHTTDFTKFVPFNPAQQELSAIQFVDPLVGGSPAVLVPVQGLDEQQTLDIYIYGCTLEHQIPQLRLLFKQQGLVQGSVQISTHQTLLVGTLDPTLSLSTTMQIEPWQQKVYHEYIWQQNAFVPLVFPGFYPVLTRSEGEILQKQSDGGLKLPWNNPLTTSDQLALDILHWAPHDFQSYLQKTTLTSAQVLLLHKHPLTQLHITLARLIRPDQHGLWFVTAAQSPNIFLDPAQFHEPLSSPFFFHGSLLQPSGIPRVTVFNHLLSPIPLLNRPTLRVMLPHLFTTTLLYTNNISGQPGLFLFEHISSSKKKSTSQLFLTGVFLT